jgi:hypothetical protein
VAEDQKLESPMEKKETKMKIVPNDPVENKLQHSLSLEVMLKDQHKHAIAQDKKKKQELKMN